MRGSPLKQSVTPSKLRDRLLAAAREKDGDVSVVNEDDAEEDGDEDEEDGGGTEVNTPTKKVKYATRPGVDLETVVAGESECGSTSGKRKRGDTSAFFALRPGSGTSPVRAEGHRSPIMEDGLPDVRPRIRPERETRTRKERKVELRRDWTYAETEWGSEEIVEANEKILEKVCQSCSVRVVIQADGNRFGRSCQHGLRVTIFLRFQRRLFTDLRRRTSCCRR